MRTNITLLLALAMLLAPVGTVAAQQGEEKHYETDVEDDRATIEISREVGEREVATEITFDTVEGAFDAAFTYENATTEAESELGVGFHQLVEYKDANGNGYYDADDDVASAWNVANGSENVTSTSNGTLQWEALESKTITSDNGTEGTLIRATAIFPEQDPVAGVLQQLGQGENRTVTVDIYVFGEPATLDGNQLGPMEVKIDLGINNYPYTANGTALALISETSSEQEIEIDDEDASRAAVTRQLEDLSVDLAFSWSDEATVDGETTTVETTTLEQETASETEEDETSSESERLLAFSYERGEEIVHDPRLGATAQSQDGGFIGNSRENLDAVPGFAAWAALVGIVSTALVVRTRR